MAPLAASAYPGYPQTALPPPALAPGYATTTTAAGAPAAYGQLPGQIPGPPGSGPAAGYPLAPALQALLATLANGARPAAADSEAVMKLEGRDLKVGWRMASAGITRECFYRNHLLMSPLHFVLLSARFAVCSVWFVGATGSQQVLLVAEAGTQQTSGGCRWPRRRLTADGVRATVSASVLAAVRLPARPVKRAHPVIQLPQHALCAPEIVLNAEAELPTSPKARMHLKCEGEESGNTEYVCSLSAL